MMKHEPTLIPFGWRAGSRGLPPPCLPDAAALLRWRCAPGFTLVETMLALGVLVLIAGLVVPAMSALMGPAAVDRAKAELASAMSDARSLARSTSHAVVVLVRRSAEGESEILGLELLTPEAAGERLAESGEGSEEPAPMAAESGAARERRRRLGELPASCEVRHTRAAERDAAASPTTATPTGATNSAAASASKGASREAEAASTPDVQLAVVFPDGTASGPVSPAQLVVRSRTGGDAVFELHISPWFAELSFREAVGMGTGANEQENSGKPSEQPLKDGAKGATDEVPMDEEEPA